MNNYTLLLLSQPKHTGLMIQAYNFVASWQLFPEKGIYNYGLRPKSGIYKIDRLPDTQQLVIYHNWVTFENEAYASNYTIQADEAENAITDAGQNNVILADKVKASFPNSISFNIQFYKQQNAVLQVLHEILPNGYLKVTQKGFTDLGEAFVNEEFYHKQMSVLPYSASVSGAVIRPTKEGVIKHKALTAMEEQTNMQLDQIRKQIELLAMQAHEIQKRKELSMNIYNARLTFKPNIGQVYYLYEKHDDSFVLSMVASNEWGKQMPYKNFVASVKLLADHTWKEL